MRNKAALIALVLGLFVAYPPQAKAQFFMMENKLVGKAVPDFTLKTTNGSEQNLAKFREGKKTIVFFWATWCPHCRESLAEMVKETVITQDSTTSVPPDIKVSESHTVEYLIYFVLGLIEILLAFRLVFKLTGANPISGFVSFIYALTQIFIMPFEGIFRRAYAPGVETTSVLEPSTLVAMAVYAVLAWGITQLVVILSRRRPE